MKNTIMYLFFFLLFSILFLNRPVYSQDTSLSSINNNLVLQRDIKESHLTSMSLGAGTALLSSEKIYTEFLFSGDINVSFNSLIKNTFLLIGFEDYNESKSSINQNRFSIYIIPNYKINI